MASLFFVSTFLTSPAVISAPCSNIHSNSFRIGNIAVNPRFRRRPEAHLGFASVQTSGSHSSFSSTDDEEDDPEGRVQDLRVPEHWLDPSKASEVSEWLRVTLHKWLDDEYCPEATNLEISKVASHSFYKSLVEKQTDVGEILLKMARELESVSYQESFHGAFSSANAAVNLIIQRMEED